MSDYSVIPAGAHAQPDKYRVHVSEDRLDELQDLIKSSRIGPRTYENLHAETRNAKYGLRREWLIEAKKEWESFDWRSIEDEINSFPNFTTQIRAIDIHFVALFSKNPEAVPVILMHGWPGSILEFLPMLALMKQQYKPEKLPFHLVVPSLPGYAFSSGPPLDRDYTMLDVADIMNDLMVSLGFDRNGYIAQGGDIGSRVSRLLGAKFEHCKAVHLNFAIMPRPEQISLDTLSEREKADVARGESFMSTGNAYAKEQGSRPATIGLVLSSSPLALLAWIGEKFIEWTDETPSTHEILKAVSLYWLTDTFARAIYPYRESYGPTPTHHGTPSLYIDKPLGYSYFPREVCPVPVSWVATTGNLVWSKVHEKGGHFAAFEQPELIKSDLEDFVKQVWKA